MGSLIKKIASLAEVGYGINILEEAPPQNVSGVSTNVAGCVGNFPWGPTSMKSITSWKQLFDAYCPAAFGAQDTYPAIKAFLSKKFPGGLKLVRALATGAAKSTKDFDDAAATESITVEALYEGLLGDSINVAISANADDANARDVTISIGTAYSQLYENVVTAAGVVTDPGDPFVVITKHANYAAVPDVAAAAALAGGADGTLVAGDLVGALGTPVGIRKFYDASVKVNVLFVADFGDDDTIADGVNAGLKAYAVAENKGIVVLATKYDQAVADEIADVASYQDDRCVQPFPLAKTTNFFDANLAEIEVQGAAWVASAIVSTDPWLAPGGSTSVEPLKGITALEDLVITGAEYEQLNTAGVAPFFMSSELGGAIVRRAVTTATDGTRIFRRRMTDYIMESLAAFLENFVEKPLDLNLSERTLGNYTGAEIAAINAWLEDEKEKKHIKDYGVNPFDANDEAGIDSGEWIIALQVELYSMQEAIVVKGQVGETVTVQEA